MLVRCARSLLLVLLCYVLSTPFVQAQPRSGGSGDGSNGPNWEDKLQMSMGFNWEFYTQSDPLTGAQIEDFTIFFNTLSVAGTYTLTHSADFYSINVHSSPSLGLRFVENAGANILAQLPAYLLGRIGAGATPYNESMFGVGAGVGLQYAFIKNPFNLIDGRGVIVGEGEIKKSYIAPAFIAEVSADFGSSSMYSLRFHMNFIQVDEDQDISLVGQPRQTFDVELQNFGIGVFWKFY